MINIDKYQAMMIWYSKTPETNRLVKVPESSKKETIIEYIKRKKM